MPQPDRLGHIQNKNAWDTKERQKQYAQCLDLKRHELRTFLIYLYASSLIFPEVCLSLPLWVSMCRITRWSVGIPPLEQSSYLLTPQVEGLLERHGWQVLQCSGCWDCHNQGWPWFQMQGPKTAWSRRGKRSLDKISVPIDSRWHFLMLHPAWAFRMAFHWVSIDYLGYLWCNSLAAYLKSLTFVEEYDDKEFSTPILDRYCTTAFQTYQRERGEQTDEACARYVLCFELLWRFLLPGILTADACQRQIRKESSKAGPDNSCSLQSVHKVTEKILPLWKWKDGGGSIPERPGGGAPTMPGSWDEAQKYEHTILGTPLGIWQLWLLRFEQSGCARLDSYHGRV